MLGPNQETVWAPRIIIYAVSWAFIGGVMRLNAIQLIDWLPMGGWRKRSLNFAHTVGNSLVWQPPPYSETIQSSDSAEWLWMDLFSKKFQIVLKSREINQAVSKNRLHEIHGRLCWSCKDFRFLNSPVKVLLNPCSVIKFTNSLFGPILF